MPTLVSCAGALDVGHHSAPEQLNRALVWSSFQGVFVLVFDLERSVLVQAQRAGSEWRKGSAKSLTSLRGPEGLYRRHCSVVWWYAGHQGTYGKHKRK